jgi:hypothetical protein
LEGSCAFQRMPSGRSKMWKRSLFRLLRVASSLFELPALSPLSPPVATPGKVSTAAAAKIMCNISFSFTLMQFFNKLIFKKRIVKNSHYISLYLCIIIFCFFSLCALLLWQKPILYSNISIIILMIIVINLVIFTLC